MLQSIIQTIYDLDLIPERVLREVAEKGYSDDPIYGVLILDFPNEELQNEFMDLYKTKYGDIEISELTDAIDSNFEKLPEIAKAMHLKLYADAYKKLVEYGY